MGMLQQVNGRKSEIGTQSRDGVSIRTLGSKHKSETPVFRNIKPQRSDCGTGGQPRSQSLFQEFCNDNPGALNTFKHCLVRPSICGMIFLNLEKFSGST